MFRDMPIYNEKFPYPGYRNLLKRRPNDWSHFWPSLIHGDPKKKLKQHPYSTHKDLHIMYNWREHYMYISKDMYTLWREK